MHVEAVRLSVTLLATAIGYRLGFGSDLLTDDLARLLGAVVGAGVGYVVGGWMGRSYRRGVDTLARRVGRRSVGPDLLAGIIGGVLGLVVGVALGVPLLVALEVGLAVPAYLLVVSLTGTAGAVFVSVNRDRVLGALGLRATGPMVARRLDGDERAHLLDSSAAIDGRVLEMFRTNLLSGRVWVPEFVLDELQGLADAADKGIRRRGKRGLDVVTALRSVTEVSVLDETVPEVSDVDAKLVVLAARSGATLLTTDHNLGQVAEVRGVRVVNPAIVAEDLRRTVATGERLRIPLSKPGTQPGQGVGYLEDGTMVVVEGAADRVGEELDVEITSSTKSSVGQLLFAKPIG
ncbi:MAG: TRAM domain-containing protein [Acidimicrobiia bacterium]